MVDSCEYVFKKGIKRGKVCGVKCKGDLKFCSKHYKPIEEVSQEIDTYTPEVAVNTSDDCLWSPQEINVPLRF